MRPSISTATEGSSATASAPTGTTSLIDELEKATHEVSHERRAQMLRSVTDLFIGNADKFSQDKVDLFGEVLGQLISQVERQALGELSARLAPLGNAPKSVIQDLAHNDDIVVAGPVLKNSPQLSDHDLIKIAQANGQEHLGSISERRRIAAAVSDILVERGNSEVLRKVSRNAGAAFSSSGFTRLTERAAEDENLAINLIRRSDLPNERLQDLISQATETVRARLLAAAPPKDRDAIQAAIGAASVKLLRDSVTPRDFTRAEAHIAKLANSNQLNEMTILNFANAKQYEELVASIAHLASAPTALIDQLMADPRHEGIAVACKAASLHWPTLQAILNNRFSHRRMSDADIERARFDFLKLTATTARRAFRFWIIRGTSDHQGATQ